MHRCKFVKAVLRVGRQEGEQKDCRRAEVGERGLRRDVLP